MSALTFGYLLATQEASGAAGRELAPLLEIGARAEALGFDAVWVPDSPFQYLVPDPLVVLSALAARTERVTLATGVLLAGLRQPALLAQQLASLDALSGAGVVVGSRPAGQLRGSSCARRRADAVATPVRPGGPELWLAGAGASADAARAEGRTRAPVADLSLTVALDRSEDVAQRRLRTTLEGWYGRPFAVISSLQATYAGTPEGLADHLGGYVAAGLEHVVLRVADESRRGLEAAAEAVEGIAVAA